MLRSYNVLSSLYKFIISVLHCPLILEFWAQLAVILKLCDINLESQHIISLKGILGTQLNLIRTIDVVVWRKYRRHKILAKSQMSKINNGLKSGITSIKNLRETTLNLKFHFKSQTWMLGIIVMNKCISGWIVSVVPTVCPQS